MYIVSTASGVIDAQHSTAERKQVAHQSRIPPELHMLTGVAQNSFCCATDERMKGMVVYVIASNMVSYTGSGSCVANSAVTPAR